MQSVGIYIKNTEILLLFKDNQHILKGNLKMVSEKTLSFFNFKASS